MTQGHRRNYTTLTDVTQTKACMPARTMPQTNRCPD